MRRRVVVVVVEEFVASNKGLMVVDSLGASVRHARGREGREVE